ncbi:unnamed protein product [Cylindrotheca closterium]|uniref:TLC domain-containing protein n=1 Tax=Cylindrotheca closterium TaxID=2856 RepID=A0AAD2FYE9_9STRA|nr:unnamed protein product [Cylindrotheca closterium]
MCDPTAMRSSPQHVLKGKTTPQATKQISGFDACRRQIEVTLLLMAICYSVMVSLNIPIAPNAELCPENEVSCERPDLVAYKITSFIVMSYMGTMGVRNWYFSKEVHDASKGTPEDRLFGYLKAANNQNVANLSYQIWDLCVSVYIPEHREPVFLVHHFLAGMTAFCSLEFQMVPYYSVFYAGCSEFSSIFLVWADLKDFIPVKEGSPLDTFIFACGALFSITFFCFRIIGWIGYSFPLWKDVIHVTKTGSAAKHRPGKERFLYFFLTLDVMLGVLQLYWFREIVQMTMGALG